MAPRSLSALALLVGCSQAYSLLGSQSLRPSVTTLSTPLARCAAPLCKVDVTTADPKDVRVLVVGATGYIGRFVTNELVSRGYQVTAFTREKSGVGGSTGLEQVRKDFPGAEVVCGDVTDISSLRANGFSKPVDVVVSCLASRTGGLQDSWDIDYGASKKALDCLIEADGAHYVLLSAICVQKPLLEFQRAKLKLEEEIQAQSDVSYSIVRPTAFFKSLAGQVQLVKDGKPYIMFGDGALSKANAISEPDLAVVMADCISDKERHGKVLPVGGPGEPLTPLQQSEILFDLFGLEPKYVKVPIQLMDVVIGAIDALGKVFPGLKDSAEFGRIGKYYAVEDMVGPSYGTTTLKDFFANVAENGLEGQELGDQAIFNIDGASSTK